MKKMTKVIALALSIMMLATALCGCGGGSNTAATVEGKYGEGEISYPIATEGEELEYYVWLAGSVAAHNVTSMNDIEFVQEYNARTGINVKYINPSSAQWDAQFDLLFTSTDLPDMIQSGWADFKEGGADGAIDAGYIADLTELLPVYAPNYYKLLQENPRYMAAATSPNGKLYGVGMFGKEADRGTYGLYIRKDWLDEVGLDVPETIDEWHTMLTAFKNKGIKYPFSSQYSDMLTGNYFNNAWGIGEFTQKDGKVVYGPATDEFKDYIKTMRQWAEEGLIDPNLPAADTKTYNASMLNNEVGASVGWLASGFGNMLRSGQAKNSKFDLVAAPWPVLNKGDQKVNASRKIPMLETSVAIAANSDNIELALRYLDYAYTEEGHELFNWGIEGKSFEYDENGNKKYTDWVLHNPDGLSVANALGRYSHAPWGSAYISDDEAYLNQLEKQQEKDALETWKDAVDVTMPEISLTTAEKEQYNAVMNDITTYAKEVATGVIFGTRDLSELENLSAKLYDMGLQDALDAYQAALDRFNKAMK